MPGTLDPMWIIRRRDGVTRSIAPLALAAAALIALSAPNAHAQHARRGARPPDSAHAAPSP